jgi:hypothetical protein
VSELVDAVAMEQSAVSHQLRLLKDIGLVAGERHARRVVYSLYDVHVAELIDQGVGHVAHLSLDAPRDSRAPQASRAPASTRRHSCMSDATYGVPHVRRMRALRARGDHTRSMDSEPRSSHVSGFVCGSLLA